MTSGFVLLAIAVASAILLVLQEQQNYRRVAHTLEVQNQLATVLNRLGEAESAQRGYLLTGNPVYLRPYSAQTAQLPKDLDALQRLVSDNPQQLSDLKRLRSVVATRDAALGKVLALYRDGEPGRARRIVGTNYGEALMDQARQIVAGMDAEEARLLAERQARARRGAQGISLGLALSTAATVALGVFAFGNVRRRIAVALAARAEAEDAHARLAQEAENREAAESQVRQMQKMEAVGQLTGGIAHDFNNMLAIIIGSLDAARRRLTNDPARAEKALDNAMEGAQRAAQLTNRLLAFSRQQPLAPRVLDANRLVAGMSELLRRTVGEALSVETVLAGGLWTTRADPGQLENAILNLCVNARDAMPEGGKLTIETANAHLDDAYADGHAEANAGQYVLISVSDTGMGMPAEVAERAFDPFFTTKAVGRGTGLGLSQVHGFVRQSGGHVKIYSEPGVGTTVKLYLPRSVGEAAAPPLSTAATPKSLRAAGVETVLVVEDEEGVRRLTAEALTELGYQVSAAADAAEALKIMEDGLAVDLLFTDVVMPGMDGRRLADLACQRRPGLKVIYTTGYTKNAIVHNGMLDAEVALLQKPFTADQLARKVREVLDQTRAAPG